MGRGPLDHLPDIGETVPRASASSPALPGGGGGAAPGLAIACPGAEANMPEARALGKRAVSPMGLMAAVEQVAAGAMQLPPQRIKGVPGFVEDRPAPADTECFVLCRKRPTEVPTLAPLKALKVNPSSTAHWVAEAQAAIQRGAASARADPKEPATQGGATEATPTRTGEGVPPPHEGEARESDGAKVPSVAEATEVEAPRVSEAKATEAEAPETIEAAAAGVGVSATIEATMAEVGALETTEADMIVARPSAQEVEMKAAEPSVAPLVQGPPSLRESARKVESQDDPKGEPLFALEDAAEGGRWDTFEQYCELAERSLRTALFVVADNLPGVAQELETRSLGKLVFLRWERDVWDQLQRQKGLLAGTNELLLAWSVEVEDHCLHCADAKAKAVTA
ncbi:uncharacterized protein [Miscanthus floridulus]|uniref:uncharacterized protein n=1 Tax=Miscanthus floridulus TaxID=154761 RepID=UPI003459E42C